MGKRRFRNSIFDYYTKRLFGLAVLVLLLLIVVFAIFQFLSFQHVNEELIAGHGVNAHEHDIKVIENAFNFSVLFMSGLLFFTIYLCYFFLTQMKNDAQSLVKVFVNRIREGERENRILDVSEFSYGDVIDIVRLANELMRNKHSTETALENAEQRLREADKLKSAFLANMSHEIRTPMNAIVGFANLLGEDVSKEDRDEFVQLIKQNADVLLAVVENIVDISKIEVGDIEIAPTWVDFKKLLSEVEQKAIKRIAAYQLDITFEVENQLPDSFQIYTDEYRLGQVIDHIVDNAFKFTESGSIKIMVDCKNESLYVKVADTGIGISEANLQRIFHNFSQVENELTREYRGTGIGLSICGRLIHLLGGEINVESSIGVGATFECRVPICYKGFKQD